MHGRQQAQSFEAFFCTAVNEHPFAFQARFAEDEDLPTLINVPTGLGKTAMAVIGWLWRRHGVDNGVRRQTPRRLVYCLPMRVLVEQTRDNAVLWLDNLKLLAGEAKFDEENDNKGLHSYMPDFGDRAKVAVHVLMGGEDLDDWDIHPERDAIIIGTQDMLLSRALNRGYAASRSRWPIQFGLLHTDCLWLFDEIQLMGTGLATTVQLEALRRLLPVHESSQTQDRHGCRSVWMSATMQRNWLNTVDFKDRVDDLTCLELSENDRKQGEVEKRWNAKKPLTRANATMGDASNLAKKVRKAHKLGTRTIVAVNTVRRACELFTVLNPGGDSQTAGGKKAAKKHEAPGEESETTTTAPRIILLHSRFRPEDRKKRIDEALADPPPEGTIIVSTQVIEAGVDVSATTLLTELAPWASLVQRFGRCNRRGDDPDARVFWIDLPEKNADATKAAPPYELDDLKAAADQLRKLNDVGPKSLPKMELRFEHTHVIRRKDLIDLFDTTPDLAGNDIDIDRFVREVEDSDVRVFWRAWDRPKGNEPPPEAEPAPRREELCHSPIGEFRNFANFANKHSGHVWRWDFLDENWEKAESDRIVPGQVYLIHADAGGYSEFRGWDPESKERVDPVGPPTAAKDETPDGTDDDRPSRIGVWQTIAEHTDDVYRQVDTLIGALPLSEDEAEALRHAARWHDVGKAHDAFLAKLKPDALQTPRALACMEADHRPAKAPDEAWVRGKNENEEYRRHFRHELASALAVLDPTNNTISDHLRDLIAYLIAAHHGKVRLSIRSLPNEMRPDPREDGNGRDRRFARGVWDGDELPETDLGQDDNGTRIIAPAVRLSLEPMELGLCEQPPFAGQPSWAERMIRLRDTLGPFRLAYLEAILRAADIRASKAAERHEAGDQHVPLGARLKLEGVDP